MSRREWKTTKKQYCEHAGEEVRLEVRIVLPPEFMPDQPPRVIGHRCSHGMQCNLLTRPTCVWSGTNPNYDPFGEE